MKRFFTSVLASLCVLAAMAVMPQDKEVVKSFSILKDMASSAKADTYQNQMKASIGGLLKGAKPAAMPSGIVKAASTDGFTKLGTGTLTDNFFQGSASVEIWKHSSYNNYFRVMNPYKGVYNNGGSSYAGSEYMDLIIMQSGTTLHDVTITKSDLVYYSDCNTGVYHSDDGGYIWACHPSDFTNFRAESYWVHNKVLSYQSDGYTPSQVQLAPIYFIEESGNGWNQSEADGRVIIKFPTAPGPGPDPYHSSVTCTNSNPSSLTTSDVLQLKAVYGNNGAAGNVRTVPVILSADGNLTLVKAGDQRSDYFSTSQTTVSYSMSLADVSEGSYYATTMFYNENEAGWFYNSSYFVNIKIVPGTVPVQSITLNKTSASLQTESPNNTLQLTATVLPTNATNKTVSWTTSNSNVATVSSSGLVTAKTVTTTSTVTITCAATDGSGVKATCTVTVTPSVIPVQSITLSQTSASLSVGNTLQLSATVLPTNATNKTVSWKSSSESVATVSSSGEVTAKSNGTTTITCSATDGSGVKATCTITVGSEPDLIFVSVTCSNENPMDLYQDDILKLKATFKNQGSSGYAYTIPDICEKVGDDLGDDVAWGLSYDYFEASANTTIDYEMALDTVPAGNYNVSVLWLQESTNKLWYNKSCIVEIYVHSGNRPHPDPCNLKGDVNGDCSVNGTDLVALTNIILGRSANRAAADVNQDGQVNGTDYVALANIILGRSNSRGMTVATGEGSMAIASSLDVEGAVEALEASPGEEHEITVYLNNPDEEITLVQFDLDLPEGLSLKLVDGDYDIDIAGRTTWKKHSLNASEKDGYIRFLLASSSNATLSGTEGAVIKMTVVADENYDGGNSVLAFRNILLVNPDEKETKPEDIVITPVGIAAITTERAADATIYSVSGQRIDSPRKGINIIGGKKMVVK